MYPEFRDVLSAFHAHGVKYLVVGGYAVIFHSQPRATKDLDLLIQADPANAQATYAALAEFGLSLGEVRPEDFENRKNFFRFGHQPRCIDILPDIPGIDFDAAWERRIEAVIDPATGLKANFISADDLVASKLAAGRAQDLADAAAIRQASHAQRKGSDAKG